jgi:hypothetical protein
MYSISDPPELFLRTLRIQHSALVAKLSELLAMTSGIAYSEALDPLVDALS